MYEFKPNAMITMTWVVLRCISRTIRHVYNAYLALNLKFEYYWVDYLRMTSFYLLYVA